MPNPKGDTERFVREVARLLRERRERLRLSKLAVAERAGLDQRTITFIEEGVNVPSIATLHALCKALAIKTGRLVEKAERMAESD